MSWERADISRFVVVAPVGRDAELLCGLLNGSGYPSENAVSIADLVNVDESRILGLILTDEALAKQGLESLRDLISHQPTWSELPIMLLTSGPKEPQYAALATQVRLEFPSLSLLDRPVRKELLLSAVQVAYRSRLKQLQVRDAAERQHQSDEALRNTEKLAVAGRLVATMAHEVNNPLAALRNLIYLAEHSTDLEEARSFTRMASQELERISEIIQHTLQFHRAPATASFTDLSEVVSSAMTLFRGRLREKHIRESVVAPKIYAWCSPGEVRQAIVNLLGNSLDAMHDGGHIYVRVSNCSALGMRCARITIADTGSGIDPEIRSNLFKQFFTTKGSRGTGLGLWLTRDIVARNNGKLRYRSRVGFPSGTAFSIYLPGTPPAEAREPVGELQDTAA